MDSSNPTMFYCKQCKTMLNEKCFLDSDTGNLNSICSMCALILKSTGSLRFTHSVEEREKAMEWDKDRRRVSEMHKSKCLKKNAQSLLCGSRIPAPLLYPVYTAYPTQPDGGYVYIAKLVRNPPCEDVCSQTDPSTRGSSSSYASFVESSTDSFSSSLCSDSAQNRAEGCHVYCL